METRGIRNCNPLNIRRSSDQWQGLCAQQQDKAFCQFKQMEYGWRAALSLLTRTYYIKYHLCTIRSIVERWAPRSENDTDAYINHVSQLSGIAPDQSLGAPQQHPENWLLLAAAMAIQENGPSIRDPIALLKAWRLLQAP